MRRAVVVGHGTMAAGLVSGVAQISGRGDMFVAISNQDYAAVDLEARLREEAERGDLAIIFTDLPGGSATIAARRLTRDFPGVAVVTGANLAALLEFALSSAETPEAVLGAVVDRGRASVTLAPR